MANLRGGTLDKQIKDAFHRMEKFGVSRHGSNDHATHSVALAEKRIMYLNDFKKFSEQHEINSKLNQAMTVENIDRYLNGRLEGLARSTQEDYVRGFSSMLEGLKESNVTIPIHREYFDAKVSAIKEIIPAQDIQTNRAIENVAQVIKDLYNQRYESGVLADIQNTLGIRVSEAIELLKCPNKYIANGEVTQLVGKGNHVYETKEITPELVAKINLAENIPHENTFRNDLSNITQGEYTPHAFRYTYAEREFHTKVEAGIAYHTALKEVSISLNHAREEMTRYYLLRA